MSKVYILQKDLPGLKAGAEFIYDGDGFYDSLIKDSYGEIHHYRPSCVETNTEFFLPKKENKSNDSFQWTDELVVKVAHEVSQKRLDGSTLTTRYILDQFKQSHTPKPQAENKELVAVYHGRPSDKKDFETEVKKASEYYGKNILCEECGEIGKHKKTCSQAENKQYERMYFNGEQYILGKAVVGKPAFLRSSKGNCQQAVVAALNTTNHWMCDPIGLVASSDKSLGLPSIEEYAKKEKNKSIAPPFKFEKHSSFDGKNVSSTLLDEELKWPMPSEEAKQEFKKFQNETNPPLTEDKIPLFYGDVFWVVDLGFKKSKVDYRGSVSHPKYWPHYKFFGKEEAADQYIIENKPLNLSMKEIASCITNYVKVGSFPHEGTAVIDWKKLDEIIKTKS